MGSRFQFQVVGIEVDLPEKMTFEQRFEYEEEIIYMDIREQYYI